nr:MAG TPA: hypothetical protein [Caudoviricetes sp.]
MSFFIFAICYIMLIYEKFKRMFKFFISLPPEETSY